MVKSPRAIAASLVISTVALIGCSSDDKKSSATTTPASEPAATQAAATGPVLTIAGFAFSGGSFKANEAITVTNEDTAPHTVTADDGSFSVDVAAGTSEPLTITAPGTYAIHCNVHSQMSGSITVD